MVNTNNQKTNNQKIREYDVSENGDFNNKFWTNKFIDWWSGFSLRTKLLAIATLVVSLLTVSYTHLTLPTTLVV